MELRPRCVPGGIHPPEVEFNRGEGSPLAKSPKQYIERNKFHEAT